MNNIESISRKKLMQLSFVMVLGFAILGLSIVLRENRIISEWNGEIYRIENVNSLDAAFAHPYNKAIDNAGTLAFIFAHLIVCTVCFLIPGIEAIKKRACLKAVVFDFIVYIESWAYTFGVYRILKTVGGRIRPYMYFPNPSLKDIAEGDFISSWPSGHSSVVFLAGAFLFWWLKDSPMKPASKKILMAAVLVIGILTMVLRILSGNHFPTDVLTGAFIGFVVASIVSVANRKILTN